MESRKYITLGWQDGPGVKSTVKEDLSLIPSICVVGSSQPSLIPIPGESNVLFWPPLVRNIQYIAKMQAKLPHT